MSTQPKAFLTPEQYLEIERKAANKSEYFRGEMFAMAGARLAHNRIVANLIGEAMPQLRSSPCSILPSDMRVQVADTGLYTYPDAIVVCGEPHLADSHMDTLLNPTVLIEVLSPSTEAYDRGAKFKLYQSIESLKEYLLIAADYMQVDLYTRQPDGKWLVSIADKPEDVVELQSAACRLRLAGLYDRVEFNSGPGAGIRPPGAA